MDPKFTHILFDLDGTLIDSCLDLANAYNALLAQHNRPPQCIQALKKECAIGFNTLLDNDFGAKAKSTKNKNLRVQLTAIYEATLTQNTTLFPGIESLLTTLTNKAVPWGIVTNKNSRFAEPLVDHFDVLRQAKVLVCGNTLPESKPHPRPILYACEQLRSAPSRTAMIGDTIHDILSAQRAGAKAVLVTYNIPMSSNEQADLLGADIQFAHTKDLSEWLLEHT